MRNESGGDPFNTPFENWYHEQRQDPYSPVNAVGRYVRFFLWGGIFLLTVKFLSGMHVRKE